ncbi:Fe-S protein assembly co-chaperone HscB [Ottowia sp.]|uniref:Fe-S protein assembly co-chaperone HscB n=1 Tax=Ottowia sp. TaxID=1898956 RepID=UPI002C2B0AAC|nr:Fe-S protein assembly co-chaperone HscB [Ottowia sp.]HOB65839.1 Fe-S protein assembly co-chaperone HscB [Ottowia sp.]HPZ58603.1 Fe-S protein assembly co-chaperone HscB [Ottowia sp.]HQD46797.1 Fe-S protein assembly co-chaperone HscB [Ottowia sp.]
MNLQSTDFELFDVPARFAQDAAKLDARWKDLQRQVHPDRFAAQGAAAQRVAAQWSARINEAHRRLKDPQRRAAYLCELHGAPIEAESNTAMPAQFLMQQMELREQLDEATSAKDLDDISRSCLSVQRELLQKLEHQMDGEHDWLAAAQSVRALMFLDKLAADIDRRHEKLETD